MADLGLGEGCVPPPPLWPKISSFSCSFWEIWPIIRLVSSWGGGGVVPSREIMDLPLLWLVWYFCPKILPFCEVDEAAGLLEGGLDTSTQHVVI